MSQNIKRLLNIDTRYSSFLWDAIRTGKSHWVKHNFKPEEIMLIDIIAKAALAEKCGLQSLII